MCGRYILKNEEDLEAYFQAVMNEVEQLEPNYNVAPTHQMPVIHQNENGKRTVERFRWGLLPFWAKEKKMGYSMINARSETIDSKKSFAKYFKRQRCLVPATGFYEWRGSKGNKTPFLVHPTHEPLFAFAGLYSEWKSPEGETVPSYTIVTTKANEKMQQLHDRMPVMLLAEEFDEWLDPANQNTKALKDLLNPFPDDAIDFYQVSTAVNNVRNNSAELTEPQDLFDQ